MNINKSKLAVINNNRVIIVNNPNFTTTTVGFMIKAGSSNDFKGKNGVANLICEMLVDNYKRNSSRNTKIEYEYRCYASREYTYYSVTSSNGSFIEMINNLKKILTDFKFKQEDLDRIKGYILTKLDMYNDNAINKLDNIMHENMFSRQVIGKSVFGKQKTIKNITIEDLQDFYNKHYNNKNLTAIISSNLEIKHVYDILEKDLEESILSNNGIFTSFKKYAFHAKNKYIYKNIKNTTINIIFPTKGFKDYHNKVQAEIVCTLINNRYDKKDSCIVNTRLITYNSIILINVTVNISLMKISDFIEEFQKEIRSYKFSHEEFNAAVQQIIHGKSNNQNLSSEVAFNYVYHFLHLRKIKKSNFDIEIISSVSKTSIEKFINEYVKLDNMSIFCIGPKHQKVHAYAD